MRKATMNLAIYRNDNDEFLGVGCGSDFCAEHEWGINGLRRKLGMNDKIIGIDRYTTTLGELTPFEFKSSTITWYGLTSHENKYSWNNKPVNMQKLAKDNLLYINEESKIQAAWSSDDFLFIVQDKAIRDAIANAFTLCDLVIMQGGAGVFNNGSLNILLKSKLSNEVIENIKKLHISNAKLEKAVADTGIRERLRAAKKRYFALSPRWKDDAEVEIIYWLNPEEQRNNHSGWFTLQDLEDWINDTGKIPVKEATR